MNLEILILALASTVRPTSIAAVYAILGAAEPRRLLLLYILTGLAVTIAFGVLVVAVFHGAEFHWGDSDAEAIADLAGGVAALAFAIALLTGRIAARHADDAPTPSRWAAVLHGRTISPRMAALAGPATHIPGIFYLVALNVISAHNPGFLAGVLMVAAYAVIWFAIPIAALGAFIVRPLDTRQWIAALEAWTRRNGRTIVIVVSLLAAAYLIARALIELL